MREVLVCHDDEEEWMWEALGQLVQDVPVIIEKYVRSDGHISW